MLCLPAFLINLDKLPFIGDEAIRCIVAFEMMVSHNYIVPRINGEFYFSKPPLYNWILIFSYKLFGYVNEYSSRIPTVIFTLIFGGVIYLFNKDKFVNRHNAILLALMFLTCGRIMFYDSYLGLIDIFFSMITYSMLMFTYHYALKDRWTMVYFSMFSLSVVGFMLKGLPTFHFLIFNILIVHFIFGKWKKLLHPSFILSLLGFISALGLYFYSYNMYVDASKTVAPLVLQAALHSVIHHSIADIVVNMFLYPFENIYHFLPYSIFGILALRKDIFALINSNKYLLFCSMSFIANFMVYWVSMDAYPRYILMLIPLIYTIWVFLLEIELQESRWRMRIMRKLFVGVAIIVPIILFLGFFNTDLQVIEYAYLKLGILFLLVGSCSYIYISKLYLRPILLVIMVLLVRIGFNVFVLPIRAEGRDTSLVKKEMYRIADRYGEDIAVYGDTRLDFVNTAYYSMNSGHILEREKLIDQSEYYIIDSCYMYEFELLDSFPDASYGGMRWVVMGED